MEKTKPRRKKRLAKDGGAGGAGGDSSTIARKMSTIKGKKCVV
jgi:hypothetical protein